MDDIHQESQDIVEDVVSASAPEEVVTETPGLQPDGETEAPKEEKVVFSPEQQAKFDSEWSKRHGEENQTRRENEDLKRQLAEMQSSLPEETAPEIPAIPDPDDFIGDQAGFNEKMKERDAAFNERAKFDAGKDVLQAQTQQQTLLKQQAAHQKQQEQVKGYTEVATSFGISNDVMQNEAQKVSEFVGQEVQSHIAGDPHGPLITSYLAKNSQELDKVSQMSAIEAGIYIATEVKPKLTGTRKQTSAPTPPDIVNGGAAEQTSEFIKGATFE